MALYTPDPDFPDAWLIQEDTWDMVLAGNRNRAWDKFRHAKRNGWPEWVAARAPSYGSQAHELVDWMEHVGRPENSPESEKRLDELFDLIRAIHRHFDLPDTEHQAIQERSRETFPAEMLDLAIGLAGALVVAPFLFYILVTVLHYPWLVCVIAFILFEVGIFKVTLWLSGWLLNPSRESRVTIPGYHDPKRETITKDPRIHGLLAPVLMSASDEIEVRFGEWKFLKDLNKRKGADSKRREIKFVDMSTDENWPLEVKEEFDSPGEGGSALFVYRVRNRTIKDHKGLMGDNPIRERFPFALVNLETMKEEFLDVPPTVYVKSIFLYGLLGVPAGAVAFLLLSPSNFIVFLKGGFVLCLAIGCFIAFIYLRKTFNEKRRHAILDLTLREECKQALETEFKRLKYRQESDEDML